MDFLAPISTKRRKEDARAKLPDDISGIHKDSENSLLERPPTAPKERDMYGKDTFNFQGRYYCGSPTAFRRRKALLAEASTCRPGFDALIDLDIRNPKIRIDLHRGRLEARSEDSLAFVRIAAERQ